MNKGASREEIVKLVNRNFEIVYLLEGRGYLEFMVEPRGEVEEDFESLHSELVRIGYNCYLDSENGMLKVRVAWMGVPKKFDPKIPILFAVTFATVSFAGYLQISSYNVTLNALGYHPPLGIVEGTLVYAALFISALLLHEMGHYIVSRLKGVPVSLPYFIPALPPYGTFGALINMRSLPSRLLTLMNVGIAGPLAGFVGAIIVSLVGIWLSAPVSYEKLSMLPEQPPTVEYAPIVFTLLFSIAAPSRDTVILLHPIGGAGMFLLFITFLNLLPAAQLDGGHIARGVFGEDAHRILTWLTVFLLILTPYYIFGFIILLLTFIGGGRHPGSMNRLSRAGRTAYIVGLVYLALMLLCFPAPIEAVERLALTL